MKTCVHLWWYLAEFFLEWEMFQTKVVEKIKTHILYSITFFRKSFRLWDNVEKCRDRQATDDNIIRRMRFACWITKATDTHSEYVILIPLAQQQWLREHASVFHYTYIDCLVICLKSQVSYVVCSSKPTSMLTKFLIFRTKFELK
jgi:hypothetical protein